MKNDILTGINDVIIDKDCMWIITVELNCLLKYHFLKKELELVAVFPKTIGTDRAAFSRIVKLENEIYFIPLTARDIFYYNLEEHKFHQLNILFEQFQDDINMDVIVQDKYIYCINRFPDMVFKINSVTKEVKQFSSDINQNIDKNIERKIYRIYKKPCFYKGKIIWSNYNHTLTLFDVQEEKLSEIILDELVHEKIERFQGIFEERIEDWIIGVRTFDDTLWLFSFEGQIYQYNDGLHRIKNEIFDNSIHYKETDKIILSYFVDIVSLKNELWFIPQYKSKCIKYHKSSSQYEEVQDNYVQNWEGYKREYSVCNMIDEQRILLYSDGEKCFYILDDKTKVVRKWNLEIPYEKFIKQNSDFNQMVIKDNVYKFDDLGCLFEDAVLINKEENEALSSIIIGKQIYEGIK